MPSATGNLSSALNRARYGISYNPTTQSSLDTTSTGISKQMTKSPIDKNRGREDTREWGSKAHEMFMTSTARRKQLEAAAESQRQLQNAANLGQQQMQQQMRGPMGQLGAGSQQGQARPMRPGQTGLPDTGVNYGPTSLRAGIIDKAKDYLGVRYVLGGGHHGGDPYRTGLDCSGLVNLVYRQMGVSWMRGLADDQTTYGVRTNINNARPGDLVGWNRGGHVGIYIGNGQILHAPSPGKTVEIRNIFRGEAIYAVQLKLPGD